MSHILQNPVWQALSTRDSQFNIGTDRIKYFPETVSPFLAMDDWTEEGQTNLLHHCDGTRKWWVMKEGNETLLDAFKIVFTIPLYQMVCNSFNDLTNNDLHHRSLSKSDIPQMLDLTSRTKPGPFLDRTIEFGNYIGIFEDDKLVSMAGERLHVNGYSEISAVCTDPSYLGKGYAAHLMSVAANKIIAEGNTPFLHVRHDNTGAIKLYEKMGFEKRADVFFAIFEKS